MSIYIREKYNIPLDAKVLLYVGNISRNKNQVQMVRAFGLLPPDVRKKTYVLFCGEDHSRDGEIEKVIAYIPDADHMILCGGVDKGKMPNYYKEADGVVLLSHTEGFGLSLVEGMHFGLPCLMPKDLDAYADIYDDSAVVVVKERYDSAVMEAVGELLSRNWNKKTIMKYSKKFEPEAMAIKYKQVYQTII